jgi:hypothetical protein
MSDFDTEAYVEGLREERARVAGQGDRERVSQIDAEISKYAKKERASSKPQSATRKAKRESATKTKPEAR